jgi:Zn-dependent peptidase ImmA (M78 family)/DNA-binding XRE family transcriptional regulator
MFNKNLKYYRLKKNMSKSKLASLCGVTPMAITNYENGNRMPDIKTIKAIAVALEARVTDFLATRNENLIYQHAEFRKNSTLTQGQQELVREAVEEYFDRFFTVVELLGGDVLPGFPSYHKLILKDDDETNARLLRKHLKLAESGPVGNLIEALENIGILVYLCELETDKFSGMNGFINKRPYIVANAAMSPERNRSTIAHELAHLMFIWPATLTDKEIEIRATSISGAFLFPKVDAVRELGVHRTAVTKDMLLVCKEYGISMLLLAKRAEICHIITESVAKDFFIQAGQHGWRKNEPSRIKAEKPLLLEQLTFRAVSENEISVQKGAELLHIPFAVVEEQCFSEA